MEWGCSFNLKPETCSWPWTESLRTSTYLVADSADVVVLFQLCVAGRGETFDLVYSISPEQETLPAQLGSEPDIIVRVDQDDGAAHHTPLPKHRLWHAVTHHAHRNLAGEETSQCLNVTDATLYFNSAFIHILPSQLCSFTKLYTMCARVTLTRNSSNL